MLFNVILASNACSEDRLPPFALNKTGTSHATLLEVWDAYLRGVLDGGEASPEHTCVIRNRKEGMHGRMQQCKARHSLSLPLFLSYFSTTLSYSQPVVLNQPASLRAPSQLNKS